MGLRVRRPDHIEYADVSERVATSDLKKLVDAGLLRAVGDRRGRSYLASDRLQELNRRIREERKSTPGPLSEAGMSDPEVVETYRERYGLNDPLPQQYLTYMTNLIQGDLGTSRRTRLHGQFLSAGLDGAAVDLGEKAEIRPGAIDSEVANHHAVFGRSSMGV